MVQPNSENVRASFLLSNENDTIFGQASTFQANPNYFPSGTKWTSTSTRVTGLTSKTTYNFAILIENNHSIFGRKSFTTL
jgi:hypothetical protein